MNRDKSSDRYPGTPRDDDALPEDLDALGEREEMARLMKTLRDSIPFQEEELLQEEEPPVAYEPTEPDPEPAYEPLPEPDHAGLDFGTSGGDGGSDEDDFARLLRTLREGIPDEDPEPLEPLDELTPYDPHRYEPPEGEARPYDTPYDAPYDPSPLQPPPAEEYAAYEAEAEDETGDYAGHLAGEVEEAEEAEEAEDGGDEGEAYEEAEALTLADEGPAPAAHSAHRDDHHPLDVSPGEQAVIADLLRSIHGEDPGHDSDTPADARSLSANRRDAIGHRDLPAADFDEEERSDRGQAWKIVLALGAAAALGLVIALVNPFGDKTLPQTPNRVVVPLPPPPAPRPSTQMAEIAPVVIPPPPAPPPAPAPAPVAAQPPKPEPPPPPAPKPVAAPPQVAALPPVAVPPPAPQPPPTPAPPPVASHPVPKPEPVKPEPVKVEAPKPPPPKPEPAKPAVVVKAKPVEAAEPPIAPEERVAVAAGAPAPTGPRVLTVQVGSFKIADNAERLIKTLKQAGFDAYGKDWTDRNGQLWHVVRVGRINERDRAAASSLAQKLRGRPEKDTFVFSVQAP